jgi:hypothetical protein
MRNLPGWLWRRRNLMFNAQPTGCDETLRAHKDKSVVFLLLYVP